jgi:hypothetical protein
MCRCTGECGLGFEILGSITMPLLRIVLHSSRHILFTNRILRQSLFGYGKYSKQSSKCDFAIGNDQQKVAERGTGDVATVLDHSTATRQMTTMVFLRCTHARTHTKPNSQTAPVHQTINLPATARVETTLDLPRSPSTYRPPARPPVLLSASAHKCIYTTKAQVLIHCVANHG